MILDERGAIRIDAVQDQDCGCSVCVFNDILWGCTETQCEYYTFLYIINLRGYYDNNQ